MTRRIKKIAIVGSGIMGSGIACHFANIGVEVLLLDIVPRELNDKEKAKGLTLENKIVRNRLVNEALMTSLKSKPSLREFFLFFVSFIECGFWLVITQTLHVTSFFGNPYLVLLLIT